MTPARVAGITLDGAPHGYLWRMELDAALSRALDVQALDLPVALQRCRDAIESLAPGGALSILAGDRALEDPLRAVSVEKGYDLLDVSEPATLRFLVYRPF